MRFEITFPAGWRTQDQKTRVVAVAPGDAGQLQLSLAEAGELSPAAYVAALRERGRIGETRGGAETVGGWPAWVGRIVVADAQGATSTLVAAWVRQAPGRMLQVLGAGRTVTEESAISAAARSLRPLTDAARLEVAPPRVRLLAAPASGTFAIVFPRLGPQAIGAEEGALINGLALDEDVRSGETLKLVRPGTGR
jgi:predicted Zn-dependent protease